MALSPQRRAAIHWAKAQWDARVTEMPPGSNRGPQVSSWQREIGGGATYLEGEPWCGVFLGMALKHGGVKVTPRIASVALIEDDARAGRNGFERVVDWRHAMPGDAVILFGRGVHVELLAWPHKNLGYLSDYGGNTSYEGSNASQSNGGCVALRKRPRSDVYLIVRPHYGK